MGRFRNVLFLKTMCQWDQEKYPFIQNWISPEYAEVRIFFFTYARILFFHLRVRKYACRLIFQPRRKILLLYYVTSNESMTVWVTWLCIILLTLKFIAWINKTKSYKTKFLIKSKKQIENLLLVNKQNQQIKNCKVWRPLINKVPPGYYLISKHK